MADYTKSTNFTAKDSLSSGDPNKIVKGSEIDTEYNNIQTAVNSKLDTSSLAANGGTIPETNRTNIFTDNKTIFQSALVRIIVNETDTAADTRYAFYGEGSAAGIEKLDDSNSRLIDIIRFTSDGGIITPGATGGSFGAGTINAEEIRENGNLISSQTAQRVALGGSFDAGQEVVCVRHGNVVTITSDGVLSHSDATNAGSTSVIPSGFRPSTNQYNTYFNDPASDLMGKLAIDAVGQISIVYQEVSTGNIVARPDTFVPFTISYVITGNVS